MRLWPERRITIWLKPTPHKRLVEAAKAGKVPKFKSYVDGSGLVWLRIPQSLASDLRKHIPPARTYDGAVLALLNELEAS